MSNVLRCIGAALAWVSLATAAPADPQADPAGRWRGEYVCNQGLTGLTLEIARAETGPELRAVFVFYQLDVNPGVPGGCHEMSGRIDAESGRLALTAGRWIVQPWGYVTVDLDGAYDAESEVLRGRVLGPGCTTFTLLRDDAPDRLDHPCYDPPNVAGAASGSDAG